jgi:uncharacterized membrane protein
LDWLWSILDLTVRGLHVEVSDAPESMRAHTGRRRGALPRTYREQEHPMPSAQRSITINRPIEEVFAFFTDPSNDPKWRTHLKEISTDTPVRIGARIHQVVQGPAGRGMTADIEVTAYEPLTRYAFRVVEGPVRPVGEFRFAPEGDATWVSLSLSADLSGLKKVLLARPVQGAMDGEVHRLDRAKALIES